MDNLDNYLKRGADSGAIPPALGELLSITCRVCGEISQLLGGGSRSGVLGSAGTENIQGETQKKLDVISNDRFVEALPACSGVAGMASEEMEDFMVTPAAETGSYLLLFDPLDGSSNIDVNISVGTIFSVLEKKPGSAPRLEDFLQPGHRQVAAGFAVYGPSTILVLAVGSDLASFTLDRSSGRFLHNDSHPLPWMPPSAC